jgi:hypothetical protein
MNGHGSRRRGGAADRCPILSNDLFEAMQGLRERDGDAFAALLEFAWRLAALADD